ncbi:MAG: hypothetical protein N4A49_07000 [Marinifilaceae bacterium]|jgi:hypothetical protein|nr:hypothetical protein [Marinifilaceae bacterium]
MESKLFENRHNLVYFLLSFFGFITAQILTHFYRPYIYNNGINDYGFADTIGSLASVFVFCFFVWGIKEHSDCDKNIHIISSVIVYSLWEILGLLGIHGVFDWKDIVAVFISGFITFLIKQLIQKK